MEAGRQREVGFPLSKGQSPYKASVGLLTGWSRKSGTNVHMYNRKVNSIEFNIIPNIYMSGDLIV